MKKLLAILLLPLYLTAGAKVGVSVSGSTAGPIKMMNGVNNGPTDNFDHCRTNFGSYKALNIPMARLHDSNALTTYGAPYCVDVHAVFPDFNADPLSPSSYIFAPTDKYIDNIIKAGTKVCYRLGATIEHGVYKKGTVPPPDFEKWALICAQIIRHYNEGWADGFHYDIEYWEIWNEPDNGKDKPVAQRQCWGGSPEDFIDFYEIAAKYLKKEFPSLKIGGPALSNGIDEYAENFLSEMQKRGVPMDFYSWHRYATKISSLTDKAVKARALMEKYGYSSAESICNEWNYVEGWKGEPLNISSRVRRAMKGAAFTAAFMQAGQEAPVDIMNYYDARPCGYNGIWDFYDYHIYPSWYAFKSWDCLRTLGTQLSATSTSKDVYVTAAVGKDGSKGILATWYVPDETDCPKSEQISFEIESASSATVYLVDEDHEWTEIKNVSGKGSLKFSIKVKPQSIVYIEAR